MALKNLFDALKREGYIVKDLDVYLLGEGNRADENRAIDVNAPSQVGKCMRSRYYARTGEPTDPNTISARAQRIFDNGTGVHERLQGYLKNMGKLLMDELPVHDVEYNIQGHTDGMFVLTPSADERYAKRAGVLEIKSINNRGFTELKDAKDEHKKQGLVYLYCLEKRRQELHKQYASLFKFLCDKTERYKEYAKLYQHLVGGSKHTRDEKIQFQCDLHNILDNILFRLEEPVDTVVFLYENKDNQELKEFVVSSKDRDSKHMMDDILKDYDSLNRSVETKVVPPRCATKKTDNACRWCDYKIACWG